MPGRISSPNPILNRPLDAKTLSDRGVALVEGAAQLYGKSKVTMLDVDRYAAYWEGARPNRNGAVPEYKEWLRELRGASDPELKKAPELLEALPQSEAHEVWTDVVAPRPVTEAKVPADGKAVKLAATADVHALVRLQIAGSQKGDAWVINGQRFTDESGTGRFDFPSPKPGAYPLEIRKMSKLLASGELFMPGQHSRSTDMERSFQIRGGTKFQLRLNVDRFALKTSDGEDASPEYEVWFTPFPDGEPERVLDGTGNFYRGAPSAADALHAKIDRPFVLEAPADGTYTVKLLGSKLYTHTLYYRAEQLLGPAVGEIPIGGWHPGRVIPAIAG